MQKYAKIFFLIVSLILIFSAGSGTLRLLGRNDAVEEARIKAEELEREYRELEEALAMVETEEFVEQEAREKLGLAKPGEVVVVLPEEEILRRIAPKFEDEDFVEKLSIWKRWVRMFF